MKALLWCKRHNRPTLHDFGEETIYGNIGKMWYVCSEDNCGERRIWGNEYLPYQKDVEEAREQSRQGVIQCRKTM